MSVHWSASQNKHPWPTDGQLSRMSEVEIAATVASLELRESYQAKLLEDMARARRRALRELERRSD